MDVAKFTSLLSKKALYFACPTEFNDPYEGYIPKKYAQNYASTQIQNLITKESERDKLVREIQVNTLNPINKAYVDCQTKKIDDEIDKIDKSLIVVIEKNILESGVNCWHKNEHESEAMWKLYTALGQGIAIESTIGQLTDSITYEPAPEIKSVSYLSDESIMDKEISVLDPLFMKRVFFDYEKELRAVIKLKEKGKGMFVDCTLNVLINRIHISPLVPSYLEEIVKDICFGKFKDIENLVIRSTILDKPDYSIKVLAT